MGKDLLDGYFSITIYPRTRLRSYPFWNFKNEILRCFQWNDVYEAASPVGPTSDVRERSPEVDRLIRTVIMKSPDSTNRPVNCIIHIPALRNFNAGMCHFFPSLSFRGLEASLRIENGGKNLSLHRLLVRKDGGSVKMRPRMKSSHTVP